uniref:Doublecortin domain-containing protein n=1 Tax=Clytia hemisphaerica TaxID=252671 RepID=A0A7M5XNG7_9CNID
MQSPTQKKIKMLTKKIRPVSAKPSVSFGKFDDPTEQRINQDILVTKYLEHYVTDFKKSNKTNQRSSKNDLHKSPYASHVSLREATSDTFHNRKNTWSPYPPKSRRPISAPVYKNGNGSISKLDLNSSFTSSGAVSFMSSSVSGLYRQQKPVYKRKHKILCVQAYVNGTHIRPVRVTAPDLSQLLIECTHKLGLTSAARKLYLSNGNVVTSPQQLSKDEEIYVSMGEPFKNPVISLQERERLKQSSFWTLNGIMLPFEENNNRKPSRTSTSVTHCMTKLVESQKRRILVFKNGESFGGVEVVANRFEEFLDDCTKKLSLTSSARHIYDWSGKQVENFNNVPSLDKSLQPTTGPVLGPLWVSKGERFSPKGAHNFLNTMIQNTKDRIKSTNIYLAKLHEEMASENSYFTLAEIEIEIDQEDLTLAGLERALPPLENYLKNIQRLCKEEEASLTPSSYKFKHISEIDTSSRLLTTPGIKIRLYVNGRKREVGPIKVFVNIADLKKGTKTQGEVMTRFFDLVNMNPNIRPLFGIKANRVYVKRAFLLNGSEVIDIGLLEPGQELWLSLGEGFLPIEIPIVCMNLDKVKLLSLWGWKQVIQKDLWMGSDQNQTHPKLWQMIQGVPPQCESQEMKVEMSNPQKIAYLNQCNAERLNENRPFLQSKQDHSLVLYPELAFETQGAEEENGDIWGRNIQKWIISPDGTICNKHLKGLYIGVLDEEIEMIFKSEETGEEELLEGASVGLRFNNSGGFVNTQFNGQFRNWIFTHDGYIQPTAFPEYVLTAVDGFTLNSKTSRSANSPTSEHSEEDSPGHWEIKSRNELIVTEHQSSSSSSSDDSDGEDNHGEDAHYNEPGGGDKKKKKKKKKESQEEEEEEITSPKNENNFNPFIDIKDQYGGQNTCMVILPRFPSNHRLASTQRWGIKCESPEQVQPYLREKWVQQCLTWPADERGNIMESPTEGYLTYGAPKIKWRSIKSSEATTFSAARNDLPVKLQVLKNGESDINRAVPVIAPDIRNIKKDINVSGSSAPVNGYGGSVCMTPLDIEFQQFLERCTDALNLPFAARRVFTADGKEVLSLTSLEKNDLIYVSCGDNWNNPSLSQADQQKRLLLASLTSDILKIKKYIALRNCAGFILRMESDIFHRDSKLSLMKVPQDIYSNQIVAKESDTTYDLLNPNDDATEEREMSAHQRTHARLDARHADDQNGVEDMADRESISHREVLFGSNEGVPSTLLEQQTTTCNYKWIYRGEFIQLESNPNMVIGLQETDASVNLEVVVCKKRFEDPNQRWTFADDGTISLVSNPNLVLTVATPSMKDEAFVEEDITTSLYDHARLIVTNRKAVVNGNANQIFWLDEETKLLHAFATDDVNIELTSAIQAAICSYSVFGETTIYQPGYFMKRRDGDRTYTLTFCEPCGRVIRGKQKLQRITDLRDFKCCMGQQAKKSKIKFKGAFQCLESKVDLSAHEAETTLALWESQLHRLREESSVRVIASEITMTQNNPAVRLIIRRNGEGCSSNGMLLIGNMLSQILDDCTSKLNLPHAARRLYTMDGELITSMQQLLKPYYPELTYLRGHQSQTSSPLKTSKEFKERVDVNGRIYSNGSQEYPEQQDDGIEQIENLQIEKLDVRVPIDVWVSMGEPFAPLGDVEKAEILSKYEIQEKSDAITNLQIQKHRLRHAKGRRLTAFKVDPSPVKSAWVHRTDSEQQIEVCIDRLKNQLDEVKSHQLNRAKSLNMKKEPSMKLTKKMEKMKLYQMPRALKIKIFPNGESSEKFQTVFAQNFHQLLENGASKLQLTSCARRVFTHDGIEIFSLDDVSADQAYCLTCGERFVPYRERRHQIDLKAAYSRINRRTNLTTKSIAAFPLKGSEVESSPSQASIQILDRKDDNNGTQSTILARKRPPSARPKSARPNLVLQNIDDW